MQLKSDLESFEWWNKLRIWTFVNQRSSCGNGCEIWSVNKSWQTLLNIFRMNDFLTFVDRRISTQKSHYSFTSIRLKHAIYVCSLSYRSLKYNLHNYLYENLHHSGKLSQHRFSLPLHFQWKKIVKIKIKKKTKTLSPNSHGIALHHHNQLALYSMTYKENQPSVTTIVFLNYGCILSL